MRHVWTSVPLVAVRSFVVSCLAGSSLVVSSLVGPVLAQEPAPESHRWGLQDGYASTGAWPVDGQLAPDDILTKARAAGFGWMRYTLFWHLANPAPGEYDWMLSDLEIDRLRAAGFNVLVQVSYPPAWTTGNSYPNHAAAVYCLVDNANGTGVRDEEQCTAGEYRPGARMEYRTYVNGRLAGTSYPPGYDRSGDFRTFLTAAVQRYRGKVQAWGASSEAHTKIFWRGTGVELVDEMLRPTYEIVKQYDQAAVVVGPDADLEDGLASFLAMEGAGLAAGRSPLFDVLAFHVYNHSGFYEPEYLETGLRKNYVLMPSGECERTPAGTSAPPAQVCSISNVLARHGRGRPFWLTEAGYRVAYTSQTAADFAQSWMSRWIQGIKRRPWIDKTFFGGLRHEIVDPPGDFGLFLNDAEFTPTPIHPVVASALATLPPPAFSYLAEGATGFFDLDVCVANPNPVDAPVKVSFLKPNGSVDLLTETLPARSRRTYRVKQLPGLPSLANTAVSTVVESTLGLPLVTERTMFWDGTYYGGHGGTAITEPAKTWYFAEGSQGFFDTYLLLANSGNVTANVTVTFLRENGEPPVTLRKAVKPTSRENVWTGDAELDGALTNRSFGIRVESDQPIIAERAMYFGAQPFWNGGHESAGVPAPSRTWFLAEGQTGPFFDEYILVSNPGEADARVTFTFLLESGETIAGTKQVAGNSRFTLDVEAASLLLDAGSITGNAGLLANAAVSVKVEADEPIVVERAMYWPGAFTTWAEAHNSFGVTDTGTRWGLAEGRVGRGRGFDTYILLANPGVDDVLVTITYLRSEGRAPIVRTYTLKATSRQNVNPLAEGLMTDEEFGALIEATAPIVVERAMYWNGPGAPFWAGGTNATATKLP
jgi:hypothetical protein